MERAEVLEYVRELRELGVQSFRCGEFDVTFPVVQTSARAPATAGRPQTLDVAPSSLTPMCRCGHIKHDHRADVGCIHGCDARLCVSVDALRPPTDDVRPATEQVQV